MEIFVIVTFLIMIIGFSIAIKDSIDHSNLKA